MRRGAYAVWRRPGGGEDGAMWQGGNAPLLRQVAVSSAEEEGEPSLEEADQCAEERANGPFGSRGSEAEEEEAGDAPPGATLDDAEAEGGGCRTRE